MEGGVSAFEEKNITSTTSQRRKCSFIIYFRRVVFWWCAHHGRVGSLWENRQCLICYDMNTQLDHRVQILQSAVRCQAALGGSSSGSEPVTHHIKITGESEAFFLSDHLPLQEHVGVAFILEFKLSNEGLLRVRGKYFQFSRENLLRRPWWIFTE